MSYKLKKTNEKARFRDGRSIIERTVYDVVGSDQKVVKYNNDYHFLENRNSKGVYEISFGISFYRSMAFDRQTTFTIVKPNIKDIDYLFNAIIVGVPKYDNKLFTVAEIKQLPEFVGDLTEDLTELRNQGSAVHRAELDNQPMLRGLVGPMWDGDKLRYETVEVYNAMYN